MDLSLLYTPWVLWEFEKYARICSLLASSDLVLTQIVQQATGRLVFGLGGYLFQFFVVSPSFKRQENNTAGEERKLTIKDYIRSCQLVEVMHWGIEGQMCINMVMCWIQYRQQDIQHKKAGPTSARFSNYALVSPRDQDIREFFLVMVVARLGKSKLNQA